ncbi:MAG: amidase family protein [Candidatus Thermoplasmatota archaeon]|nr:amidase family protein [Candidatus Thermoplasmatota archaeon]
MRGPGTLPIVALTLLLLTVGCLGAEPTEPAEPTLKPAPELSGAPSGEANRSDTEPRESDQAGEPEAPQAMPVAIDCMRYLGPVDLQQATMVQLQAAMRAGEITAVDLVDAYIQRFQAYDEAGPRLNSIRIIAEDARAQARALDDQLERGGWAGPLHGIPVLLKDNTGTQDMPTTAGSIALAENVPPEDATITARLRDAGAIILGKAQLSEFANWMSLRMPNGYSSLGGQVRNAYTLADPSGSSSGSGVAASMALAAGTIGTETSGSILSPSNANSVVGVKPTLGLTSRAGIIPLAHNFDVPGPMVRHVEDAALMLSAIAGSDPLDPYTAATDDHLPPGGDYTAALGPDALEGVRLGYDPNNTDELFEASLEVLTSLGAEMVPFDPGDERFVSFTEIGLIPNEFKYGINRYLAEQAGPGLPVETLTDIILYNQDHPDRVKYGQDLLIASDATPGNREAADPAALASITATRQVVDGWFQEHDLAAIVGPNAPYTSQGAAAGYPTVTVPAGYEEGDPQGLSFFGQAYSEAELLAYAYAYEQASQAREPPTVVNPALVDGVCNGEEPVEHTWPSEQGMFMGTSTEALAMAVG